MAHLLPLAVVGNAARVPDNYCRRKHNPLSDFSPWPVSLGIFIFIQLTATWIESTHSRQPRIRMWHFFRLQHNREQFSD